MPELYLTPASISYLTQVLLTSIITIYLISRSISSRKQISRQDWYLFGFFLSFTVLTLLFFLEYSLLPSERLTPFNLENTVVAILLATLIQFAYHFPVPNDKQKIERRGVLFLNCIYILWELKEAIRIFSFLQQGSVVVRPNFLQYVMIIEFAWVVFVLARNAIRNWKLPAVRNFALIWLMPLGVAILSNYQNINSVVTIIYPISSSFGILLTIFLFALNYLSSQPERVSFIVKISGAVLTSVLAVFGVIPWLITSTYADHYTSSIMDLDHRTIHFSPDGAGGYVVEEIAFRWEDELGEAVEFPIINQSTGYKFDFPFLGRLYHMVYIAGEGGIGIGESFSVHDYQYHFAPPPNDLSVAGKPA